MRKVIWIVFLFLAACGSPTGSTLTPTATPNPGEIALAMLQQQMSADATSQVVGLHITATAQVLGATATAQQLIVEAARTEQARVDAVSTAEQKRADAQATQARIDADAHATQAFIDAQATQARADADARQARIDAVATSDFLSTATFTAMTLTAIPPHATLTQMAVNNQIVIATQEVERSALSLKQARDTNVIQWMIPTLLAIGIFFAAAIYFYNQSQVRVEKNGDGDVDVIIFKNQKAFRPDLFATPLLDLKTSRMPLLTDSATQADVTRREQAIRALAAMPVHPTASGAGAFNDAFSVARPREDAFEIVDGEELPPANLLDAEALKATEKDWKEGER